MKRYEVTEANLAWIKEFPGSVVIEESKLKEIPEGAIQVPMLLFEAYVRVAISASLFKKIGDIYPEGYPGDPMQGNARYLTWKQLGDDLENLNRVRGDASEATAEL